MSAEGWKERLKDRLSPELAREIEVFETEIELQRLGKLDAKLFAETRLRRGVYGQRYDNGQRHDGVRSRILAYSSGDRVKGPDTLWDAPGMQRIKIPFGGLSPEQMEALAAVSEEHADEICHITTRQDIQLHFVHVDDTPTVMRRLAAVGITTREACGNTVRNVTACHIAGVCADEAFDVTPYANALAAYLLGHPDTQDFGRKFKVAFSGCRDKACGLVTIHDIGFIAITREIDGARRRGFEMYVGGGLGSVPYTAQLFEPFVVEEELLPMSIAVCRVFARLGEKRNRNRARMKFLIHKLGFEEFTRLVTDERRALRPDPRWTSWLADAARYDERPLRPAQSLVRRARAVGFDAWRATNAMSQKQPGYATVTVSCPLGDVSATQMRGLAALARRFTRGTVRTTVEQNLVFRWVSEADLPELYQALVDLGLGAAGAGTIVDVTACPGTDTCKLGIASSRGLAAVLAERLAARGMAHDEAVGNLRIKVSGCFNACGQHHIADIGFWGVSRKVGSHVVPHFQAVLGGQWSHNAASYGLAMGAVPSRNVPDAVDRLVGHYVDNRHKGESYQDYVRRFGKAKIRALLEDLMTVPAYDADRRFYSDWGDTREYSIGDLGVGECAGEVVSPVEFGLAASERAVFEAQLQLEQGQIREAAARSYGAMLEAAKALTKQLYADLSDDPADIVREFRARLFDTKLFFDRYAGGKFAEYLFHAHDEVAVLADAEGARQRIEEAQLFVEAAHACYERIVRAGQAS